MADPDGRHWGYDLSRVAGVSSGVLYPMLTRFLEQGLVTDGWEDPEERSGRPPRRYYQLTDAGRRELGAIATAAPAEVHAAVTRARNTAAAPSGTPGARRPRPVTVDGVGPLDPRRLFGRSARQPGWGPA